MQDEASRDVRGARDQHVKQRQGTVTNAVLCLNTV